MRQYRLVGSNFNKPCKNFEHSQEALGQLHKELSAQYFYDVVRLEYYPDGHKYAGKISSVFFAYGCHGWRIRLEEVN
jgi:hypothetical protein